MAHLKACTFGAFQDMGMRNMQTRKIGNNTYVERFDGLKGEEVFHVHLHGHLIAVLSASGAWFSNAGHGTVTTRDRLNTLGFAYGVSFFQKDWEQYVTVRGDGTMPFTGSIYIGRKAWS